MYIPATTQVSSSHRIEESLQQQLSEKRQQIVNLEHQISRYRDEIATLRGHLATSDEVLLLSCNYSSPSVYCHMTVM